MRKCHAFGASHPAGVAWGRAARAVLALWLLGLLGCRQEPSPTSASAQCDLACQRLSCGQPALARSCSKTCNLELARLTDAGCEAEHRKLMDCVSSGRALCSAECSGASCLEPPRAPDCSEARASVTACLAPCQNPGLAHHLTRALPARGVAQLEVTRDGCGACQAASKRGAPAEAACQAASVCEQSCCRCSRGRGRFLTRACVAGRCAATEEACRIAEQSVDDLCVAPAQR